MTEKKKGVWKVESVLTEFEYDKYTDTFYWLFETEEDAKKYAHRMNKENAYGVSVNNNGEIHIDDEDDHMYYEVEFVEFTTVE